MYLLCFSEMSELKAIIGLKDLRLVTKMLNGHLKKLDSRVRGLFLEREDEPLATGLINDRVLIELVRHSACITVFRDKFHVHLPFDSDLFRGIIRFRKVRFPFAFFLFEETEFSEDTKE